MAGADDALASGKAAAKAVTEEGGPAQIDVLSPDARPSATLSLDSPFARAQFSKAYVHPALHHAKSVFRRQFKLLMRNRLFVGFRLFSVRVGASSPLRITHAPSPQRGLFFLSPVLAGRLHGRRPGRHVLSGLRARRV